MTHALRLPALLLLGLTAAVLTRVSAGGVHPAASTSAGLLFAGCLLALCIAASGWRAPLDRRSLGFGALGAVLLCAPAVTRLDLRAPTTGYLSWAAAVAIVVVAEEALLRGVLFDAVQRAVNAHAAVLVSAAAFAGLHVPLYGWHVLGLDFAVGLVLGALRLASGSWAAPALAHAVADYVGWFAR